MKQAEKQKREATAPIFGKRFLIVMREVHWAWDVGREGLWLRDLSCERSGTRRSKLHINEISCINMCNSAENVS